MIWFEYKYITFSEVIKSIKTISIYNYIDFIMLFLWVFLTIVLIFYIIPVTSVYIEYRKTEKTKLKRKEFLKKIALQKNIEDKIAKEINIW